MIDPNKKDKLPISAAEVCNRAFELMAGRQFDDAERLIANAMSKSDDDIAIAIYHSALGVLYKMKGEFKNAWRHYRRAEKLMPDDPALKIISARLLIEEFAEYDQAIKKAKKVLDIAKNNPVFAHQAYTTMGLAWVKRGNRKKATTMLEKSKGEAFAGFISPQNVDLTLLEAVLRKGWTDDVCRSFLGEALEFATTVNDEKLVNIFSRMLAAYDAENPAGAEGVVLS